MDYLKSFKEMLSLRNLSDNTVKSYCTYITPLLEYCSSFLHKDPEQLDYDDLRNYISFIQSDRKLADRTINASISQIRFFFIYVLHRPWDQSQLPKRRFDSYLPFVPSQDEVKEFISTIEDLKVKAMVSLLYGSGLRVGEVCRLRYEDIERRNLRIHICHSKNRSDRYAILARESLDILTEYWFKCGRPRGYLFPQQRGTDRPIDTWFISRKIHEHEDKLGWERRISSHTFRHAFGTHLYENGADLLLIKELMGHRSLASTVIYIHLAAVSTRNAMSPLDRLGGKYSA